MICGLINSPNNDLWFVSSPCAGSPNNADARHLTLAEDEWRSASIKAQIPSFGMCVRQIVLVMSSSAALEQVCKWRYSKAAAKP
jgi:hypothetical protein